MLSSLWTYIIAGVIIIGGIITAVLFMNKEEQVVQNGQPVEEVLVENNNQVVEAISAQRQPLIVEIDISDDSLVSFKGEGEPGWYFEISSSLNGQEKTILGRSLIADNNLWAMEIDEPLMAGEHIISGQMIAADESETIELENTIPISIIEEKDSEEDIIVADKEAVEEKITEEIVEDTPKEVANRKQIAIYRVDYEDNIQLVINGFSEPEGLVRAYVDDKYIGDIAAEVNGKWALAKDITLNAGVHKIKIEDRDRVTGEIFDAHETNFFVQKIENEPSVANVAAMPKPEEESQKPVIADNKSEKLDSVKEDKISEIEAVENPDKGEGDLQVIAQETKDEAQELVEELPITTGENTQEVEKIISKADISQETETVVKQKTSIIVTSGDNLWNLAKDFYGSGASFKEIFKENQDLISNEDLIYPGQIFDIPSLEQQVSANE